MQIQKRGHLRRGGGGGIIFASKLFVYEGTSLMKCNGGGGNEIVFLISSSLISIQHNREISNLLLDYSKSIIFIESN